MNKFLKAFLSTSLVASSVYAGPIVNKTSSKLPSTYKTQVETGIESVLGKVAGKTQLATVADSSLAYYATFPLKSLTSLSSVNLVDRSADTSSVVITDYVSIPSQGGDTLGLRLALAPQESRAKVAAHLASSGLVQTGDIIVSVRPKFANTLRYLALQLLSTHVSIAVVKDGVVYNLDMPMDAEMIGGKAGFGKSVMDSNHFTADNANLMLHILRPRLNPTQKANMQKWLEKSLAQAASKTVYPSKLSFNADYNSPLYRPGSDLSFVAELGRLMLGQGLKTTQHLQMYCSEFAWALLSLSNCNPDEVSSTLAKGKTPSCVSAFFKPMQMFGSAFSGGSSSSDDYYGLVDGVRLLAGQTGTSAQGLSQMIDFAVPATGDVKTEAPGLSNGHKQVAAMMKPLIDQTNGYFKATIGASPAQIDGARAQLNPGALPNYSPTAFVVHAAMPSTAAQKKLDYVVTIKYVPGSQIQPLITK